MRTRSARATGTWSPDSRIAEVVSERFEGLTRIQQHKLIYDVFGDEVGGAIHALSIKTDTPSPAGDGR